MTSIKVPQPVILCIALLLSLSAVFNAQLLTGFNHLTGDRVDGLIQTSILEHWFNVLRGQAAWDTTNYFYPHRGTLAYNDGYLLYGLAYSGWRALGVDPFLSAELVNLLLRILGFAAAYQFACSVLHVSRGWATLGAALFTLSVSTYQQSAHAQVLSVALGPAVALLAARTLRALETSQSRAALGWGAAAAILASAWLLTAFYMAWLLAFYVLLLALAALATRPEMRKCSAAILRREWPAILAIALIGVVTAAPFLALYLPKARESGMHEFAALRPYLLDPRDTLRIGPGNLLFGWSDSLLTEGRAATSAERIVGWPPAFLACFLAAAWSWRRSPATWPAILAIGAVYALTLNFHGISGWWIVYHLIPGAKAIRVVARAWIMLTGPMLCIVLLWLRNLYGTRPLAAVVLSALLMAEQVSTGPNVALLDRAGELRHLDAVLPPPARCRAFAVVSARTDDPESDATLQTASANANAMLIAEVAGLPTINGLSTFNPPDWNAADPSRPDYIARLTSYTRAHGLDGVCGLDLRTGHWYGDLGRYRPFHLVAIGGLLSMRADEAGGELLGTGWSSPQPWGRWAGHRATLRFLPQGGRGAVRLTAWSVVFPSPPARTQRVAVMVNGQTAAIWTMSTIPAAYQALLPPDASGGAFEVTLVNLDADCSHDADCAVDSSTPSLGLIAVQLDWP